MKKKICFRADASGQIGFGHFIRSLALADMLKDDFDCVFYTVEPSDYQVRELKRVCPYVSLAEETKFKDFLDYLDGSEIVVLDNYFFTSVYQKDIKTKGCKLVCIDDMHDKHYYADIVINHALGCRKEDYSLEPYTQLALGLSYALLRKPFLECSNNDKREHILICYGGSDRYNLSCKVLKVLLPNLKPYIVDVIAGDAFVAKDELAQIQQQNNNVVIHSAIPPEQMSLLMQQAKVAFLSASSVLWEAIFSGCKVIYGYYVDNQIDICKNVGNNKDLCLRYIGDLRLISDNILIDAFIKEVSDNTVPHFKKSDVRANFVSLFSQKVTVREAIESDARLYFEWANDPVVRQMAFHTEPILWDNHLSWFSRKIESSDALLLLCYNAGRAVGQVRFELNENKSAEIDISIAQEYRGNGFGKAMLQAAIDYAHNMNGYDSFVSEVKLANQASQRMFISTGFTKIDEVDGVCYYKRLI